MKKLLRVLGLAVLLTLGACQGGGGGGGEASKPAPKHVLSYWTLSNYNYTVRDVNNNVIDLRGATIDIRRGVLGRFFDLDFYFDGSLFCETQIKLSGTGSLGLYRLEGVNCGGLIYQEGSYYVAPNNELTLSVAKTQIQGEALDTTNYVEIYR